MKAEVLLNSLKNVYLACIDSYAGNNKISISKKNQEIIVDSFETTELINLSLLIDDEEDDRELIKDLQVFLDKYAKCIKDGYENEEMF